MTAVVIQADARHLPLADASVDLIVTSPPYWGMRSYEDQGGHYDGQIGAEPTPDAYIASLLEVTRECVRVLKPEGSLWVNLGDKYATTDRHRNLGADSRLKSGDAARAARTTANARVGQRDYGSIQHKSLVGLPWRYALACIDDLGLILRAEVIWSKPSALPESVTDRVRRSHEHWFHLVKQQRYYAATDGIRAPLAAPDRRPGGSAFHGRNVSHLRSGTGAYQGQSPLGSLPGSVWEVATQPLKVPAELGVDHFAAFPMEFPRRIVQGWSPPGICTEAPSVVLDPFGGTGTTALVAHTLGRHGISVDASEDYCRIARWRTSDRGEIARAMGAPKPKAEPVGQAGLFDDVDGTA